LDEGQTHLPVWRQFALLKNNRLGNAQNISTADTTYSAHNAGIAGTGSALDPSLWATRQSRVLSASTMTSPPRHWRPAHRDQQTYNQDNRTLLRSGEMIQRNFKSTEASSTSRTAGALLLPGSHRRAAYSLLQPPMNPRQSSAPSVSLNDWFDNGASPCGREYLSPPFRDLSGQDGKRHFGRGTTDLAPAGFRVLAACQRRHPDSLFGGRKTSIAVDTGIYFAHFGVGL